MTRVLIALALIALCAFATASSVMSSSAAAVLVPAVDMPQAGAYCTICEYVISFGEE